MDALLSTLLAAALAEFGDKTQLLLIALAVRFGRPAPILIALVISALGNSAIAAAGAGIVATTLPFRATTLLVALALASAGAGAFCPIKAKEPVLYPWLGVFGASLFALVVQEFGDKTQFITFALAARSGEPLLAAIGATAGIVAAGTPAVLIGPALGRRVPMKAIRWAGGAIFLCLAAWCAVDALRLA